MPELPEVETVRRDLSQVLIGVPIVAVEIFHVKTIKPLSTKELQARLYGKTIKEIKPIGQATGATDVEGNYAAFSGCPSPPRKPSQVAGR